jgi:hypothetical protein
MMWWVPKSSSSKAVQSIVGTNYNAATHMEMSEVIVCICSFYRSLIGPFYVHI